MWVCLAFCLTAIDTKGKTGGGEKVGDNPWFLTRPAEGSVVPLP